VIWNSRISGALIYSVGEVWVANAGSPKVLTPGSSTQLPIEENTSSVAMQRY